MPENVNMIVIQDELLVILPTEIKSKDTTYIKICGRQSCYNLCGHLKKGNCD